MATPEHHAVECGRVLAGAEKYDDVSREAQRLVRSHWDELVWARLDQLDLASEFARAGRTWSGLDDDGQVVLRP